MQWGHAITTLALNKRGGKVETSNNVLDDGSGNLSTSGNLITSGNVGIGTTTPSYALTIDTSNDIAMYITQNQANTAFMHCITAYSAKCFG